jgi:hypothetical protein
LALRALNPLGSAELLPELELVIVRCVHEKMQVSHRRPSGAGFGDWRNARMPSETRVTGQDGCARQTDCRLIWIKRQFEHLR